MQTVKNTHACLQKQYQQILLEINEPENDQRENAFRQIEKMVEAVKKQYGAKLKDPKTEANKQHNSLITLCKEVISKMNKEVCKN